jgi:hypothetical protein
VSRQLLVARDIQSDGTGLVGNGGINKPPLFSVSKLDQALLAEAGPQDATPPRGLNGGSNRRAKVGAGRDSPEVKSCPHLVWQDRH